MLYGECVVEESHLVRIVSCMRQDEAEGVTSEMQRGKRF